MTWITFKGQHSGAVYDTVGMEVKSIESPMLPITRKAKDILEVMVVTMTEESQEDLMFTGCDTFGGFVVNPVNEFNKECKTEDEFRALISCSRVALVILHNNSPVEIKVDGAVLRERQNHPAAHDPSTIILTSFPTFDNLREEMQKNAKKHNYTRFPASKAVLVSKFSDADIQNAFASYKKCVELHNIEAKKILAKRAEEEAKQIENAAKGPEKETPEKTSLLKKIFSKK